MRRVALTLGTALLVGTGGIAASCGGGGSKSAGTDTSGGTTTEKVQTTETIVGTSDAYKTGQAICGNNPLEILAQQYGVKPEPNAIAKAVSLQFASAKDRKDAVAGCLAALKGQAK